jgi:hypothetical protein
MFNLEDFPSKLGDHCSKNLNPTSKLVFKHDLLLCDLYFNILNHFYNYIMLQLLFIYFLERENPCVKIIDLKI